MNLVRTCIILTVATICLAACGSDGPSKSTPDTSKPPKFNEATSEVDPTIAARFHPLSPIDSARTTVRCSVGTSRTCRMEINGLTTKQLDDDSVATLLVLAGRAAFASADTRTVILEIDSDKYAPAVATAYSSAQWKRLLALSQNPAFTQFHSEATYWLDKR